MCSCPSSLSDDTPTPSWLLPQHHFLCSLMLLSLLPPRDLSVPLTGILFLCSSQDQVLLTHHSTSPFSCNFTSVVAFSGTVPQVAPKALTQSVSLILFPMFLSSLFPPIITLWYTLVSFLFTCLLSFYSHTFVPWDQKPFLAYLFLSSAPTTQPFPIIGTA